MIAIYFYRTFAESRMPYGRRKMGWNLLRVESLRLMAGLGVEVALHGKSYAPRQWERWDLSRFAWKVVSPVAGKKLEWNSFRVESMPLERGGSRMNLPSCGKLHTRQYDIAEIRHLLNFIC